MCGRYTVLTEDEIIEIREILKKLSLRVVKDDYTDYSETSGDVYPTNKAPLIRQKNNGVTIESAKWGFKKWTGSGVIINARSETMGTNNTFSKYLKKGRCIIPAGEFFEWEKVGSEKIKHYAKDKDGNLLFMAGLYRDLPCEDNPNEYTREFVIITKEACGEMAKIHNRMPVILRTNQIEPWLSGKMTSKDVENLVYDLLVEPCESGKII